MISKQTQKLISTIFAVLAMVLGSLFLVALAQGYRYDFLTGQIRESGLVIIDSQPNNADIYINGKRSRNVTPYRLTGAPLGNMNVELIRPEFRVWKKSLTVEAREVSFANYAILLPQKLSYQTALPEFNFSQVTQSNNQRTTYALTTKPEVAVWKLSGTDTPQKIYAPTLGSGPVTLANLRVNEDGSRLLVDQQSAAGVQTLAILNGDTVLNLTTNLQVNGGSLSFHPENRDILYWISPDKLLRKIDVARQTVSAVVAQNVLAIAPDGNDLYAVAAPDASSTKNTLRFIAGNGQKTTLKTTLPQSNSYVLQTEQDRSGLYLALLSTDTKELYIIRDLKSEKPLSGVLSKTATSFTISRNGERILYNADNKLKTYDIDQAERFDFGVSLANLQGWSWYDDNHIIIAANKQLRLIDYDGQNDQIISDRSDSAEGMYFKPSAKEIFYTTSGTLKQVKLTQD